jgi:hypothetical protein
MRQKYMRLRDRTGCLGIRVSNCEMLQEQNPFETAPQLSGFWPKRRSRDHSRLSYGVANMQLPQGFRRGLPRRTFAPEAG